MCETVCESDLRQLCELDVSIISYQTPLHLSKSNHNIFFIFICLCLLCAGYPYVCRVFHLRTDTTLLSVIDNYQSTGAQ
jgi:hypothetical protein